jgi:Fe-S cluster biogenesis protein NfuA
VSAASDARVAGERVEHLLEQLRSGSDPAAAAVAEELVGCLVRLYGAGLERITRILGTAGARPLCDDPLVESLLLVHDLHPLDPDTRIRRAVDHARASFGSYTGAVDYLGTDAAGVARIRMQSSGGGCGSSVGAVRQAIETAIQDAAPEVTGVEVEVTGAPAPLLQIARRPGLGPAARPAPVTAGRTD